MPSDDLINEKRDSLTLRRLLKSKEGRGMFFWSVDWLGKVEGGWYQGAAWKEVPAWSLLDRGYSQ